MTKTSYIQWDDIHFVLYQHALLDLYSASSMKQSAGRYIDIIGTHYQGSVNLYRGPSIRCFLPSFGSFGQAVSEEKIFKNRPFRNKNCLWQDRDKMSNLYKGPSINASYQVSVHLAEGFQRRRLKCEKLTDDGRQVMAKAHIAFGKVS